MDDTSKGREIDADTLSISTVRATLDEVTRQFAHPVSIDETLAAITTAATTLIGGTHSADVESYDYRSAAATSPMAKELSCLQQ